MYENMEMRKVFSQTLERIMEKDERIVVIDADLAKANGTLSLRERFPERAFDVGVAEQNMASVAAGLAAYGFIPFIGSFATFATRRICDQIAISIAYAGLNVKIVGSDPGIAAELNGGTHMSFEDIGVLRSIPGILIFEPVDNLQLAQALPQIINYKGVVYIRMFRKVPVPVFKEDYKFSLLQADVLQEGRDVTLFASGIMVAEALTAAEILKEQGISAEVINIHTIKPLDKERILASARKTGAVVTCENHNLIGGLRSAVAEVLIENYPVPLRGVGVNDCFGEVGKMDYLRKRYKLRVEDIVEAALAVIADKER